MKKIITATLSACALTTMLSATDTSPMYTNQTALETKQVMMLSQMLSGDLSARATYSLQGKRGFFASMSENTDKDWEGFTSIDVEIGSCISAAKLEEGEKLGITYTSHIADSTVIGYREAVKQLKEMGAKYILVYNVFGDKDYSLYAGKSFADLFQGELTRKYTLDNNDLRVLTEDGHNTNAWRTMDERCFQDRSLTAKNVLWGAAKIALLGVGLKGASLGSTKLTSFSSAGDQALGSGNPVVSVASDNTHVAGIATRNSVSMYGAVYADHFDGRGRGYYFPIAEVEEHLAHYKNIPYKLEKY